MGRHRSAGGRLHLRARPGARACRCAARRLSRHPAGRRLCGLQAARRAKARRAVACAGILLEPCPPALLRTGQERRRRSRRRRCGASPPSTTSRSGIRGTERGRAAGRAPGRKPAVGHDLRAWLEAQIATLPARGPTAEAIRYALNHWDGLVRFLDDGRIELDTNSVERAMRPICSIKKE